MPNLNKRLLFAGEKLGSAAAANAASASIDDKTGVEDKTVMESKTLPGKSDAVCVVCLDEPPRWGVLHKSTVHVCMCADCKENFETIGQTTCPICREPVQKLVQSLS